MKKIPVIPDCYKDLPDKTLMNSRDVAEMFDYKNNHNILSYCEEGKLPKPDSVIKCRIRNSNRYHWKLGTIRKWKNDNSI